MSSLLGISRTVQNVMTVVKRQFGDESGVQLEDSDIINWVNDAQDTIVNRNRVLKAKSTTAITAGQSTVTFPNLRIIQIESVHYNGRILPNMSFVEAEQKISTSDPQSSESGIPLFWYEWAGTMTLWPTPDADGSLDLYYSAFPTRVTGATDSLSLPDKYFEDICRYVMQQVYEMDQDWQGSQAKQQQFDASV
ncbi:MAG TPA: DUF6682 family protein, partial [Nitrospira sp.]|nr:DUF6682 family protein [Nitrospira sp.]